MPAAEVSWRGSPGSAEKAVAESAKTLLKPNLSRPYLVTVGSHADASVIATMTIKVQTVTRGAATAIVRDARQSVLMGPLSILQSRLHDYVSGAGFRNAELERDVPTDIPRRGNIWADL
jgi:hypothetical protein